MKVSQKFLLVVLLACCHHTFGQITLTGKLVDAQTRKPITDAYFITYSSNILHAPYRGDTLTMKEGSFVLPLEKDEHKVVIGRLGYVPATIEPEIFQNSSTIYLEPSFTQLSEVVVSSYETDRRILETPASVGLVTPKDLQRFSNTSLVPAINTLPGVRMEERSPGSYRLSIRGSQIRSPFGVRNIKVYWNDIPFTDAGGNSPLNLLDFNHIGRMEVLKGPASSIYGAGTGGALLLYSPTAPVGEQSIQINTIAGAYGLRGGNAAYQSGSEKSNFYLSYAHQEADGYREHSAMRRDAVHLRGRYFVDEKRIVSVNAFYADLFYQTPGGLTAEQYNENPRQARQPTRFLPGAVAQQAAIYSRYFTLGVSQQYQFTDKFSNTTSLYGSLNEFANPFITNYEKRTEQGLGGRTKFAYQTTLAGRSLRLVGGGEWQRGFTANPTYGNRGGQRDTLQTDDEITSGQYFIFGQAEAELPINFLLTAGLSYNRLQYRFIRLSDVPSTLQNRQFSPVLSPRVALLKKFGPQLSVWGSMSYGFSPPSITEVRPSEGTFNVALEPEKGINYELGVRGSTWKRRLTFDITAFSLQLSQTIVRRTIASGAEYFVNAGRTTQNGLEAALSALLVEPHILDERPPFLQTLKIWISYTYHHFHFRNYVQGATDYSGNRVTGVAPHVAIVGLDAETRPGFYANATFTFTDFIPLNDANTVFANDYALLGGRLGYRHTFRKLTWDIFAGVDNALNEKYSLGNDLNAFGGRYYNASAPRNYYGGLRITFGW